MLRRGDITKNEKPRPAKIWDEHAAKFPKNVGFKNEGLGVKDTSPITMPGVQGNPTALNGSPDQGGRY